MPTVGPGNGTSVSATTLGTTKSPVAKGRIMDTTEVVTEESVQATTPIPVIVAKPNGTTIIIENHSTAKPLLDQGIATGSIVALSILIVVVVGVIVSMLVWWKRRVRTTGVPQREESVA